MAEQTFSYSPIPHDHIRLLSLERVNDQLCGKLESVLLDPSIDYVAISYCWGTGPTSRRIQCNNESFAVSENLYAALETISRASEFKFWVDAICIDQSNAEEKNIQVGKMGEIYRNAALVTVWLGESASDPETLSTIGSDEGDDTWKNDSDIAIESLQPMVEYMATLQPYHGKTQVEVKLEFYGLAPVNARIWRAFRVLLSRPWFARLWVMQEVFFAGQVVLLCGSGVTFLEPLLTLYDHMKRLGLISILRGPHASCQAGLEFMYWFNTAKELLAQYSYVTLYTFISLSRSKTAKLPVDHIYGLLGFVKPALRHEVNIDYSLESKEHYCGVFTNFVKSYVRMGDNNSVEIFHLLSLAASKVNERILPSWVPNFESGVEIDSSFLSSEFRAGISSLEKTKFQVNLISGTNHLGIRGFKLDDVCQVVASGIVRDRSTKALDSEEEGPKEGEGVVQWERKCLALSQKVYNCQPHEIPFAHKCTMVAESHPPKSYPLGKEFYENYDYARDFGTLRFDPRSGAEESGIRLKDLEKSLLNRAVSYLEVVAYWSGHPFFVTRKGRIGLGPARIQPGDVICVLYSGGPLYVLRYESDSKVATLIGDAYVYGCMELDQIPPEERGVDETFIIG
jgi:Heterokaryon incompatibility protein (HET)